MRARGRGYDARMDAAAGLPERDGPAADGGVQR